MKTVFTTFLMALAAGPITVHAQEKPAKSEGWTIDVGAGALVSPLYSGDDEYGVSAVPSIRVNYNDRFFASVETGAGYALVDNDTFRAGPLLQLEFGRDEDGKGPFQVSGNGTNDLVGLGDIDTSVSLGGFAEYNMGNLRASVKAGQALGGHDGLTGELGLAYQDTLKGFGPPIILSAGPNIKYGDADYMNAHFGVTAAQSTASGLTPYAASGGIVSYGISGTLIMPVTRKASVTLLASYDRLSGDAADAPLVKLRGSGNQFFAGAILSYRIK